MKTCQQCGGLYATDPRGEMIAGTPCLCDRPVALNFPSPEGIELGSHLARFADEGIAKLRAENPSIPERCATCAFRLGTYPNGCAVTLMNALKCSLEGKEAFYCHEREDKECSGYLAMKSEKPVNAPWDFVKGALSPLDLTTTTNQP